MDTLWSFIVGGICGLTFAVDGMVIGLPDAYAYAFGIILGVIVGFAYYITGQLDKIKWFF